MVDVFFLFKLNVFRQLRNDEEDKYFNFRPIQPINGRKLKYYKIPRESQVSAIGSFSKLDKFLITTWNAYKYIKDSILFYLNKPMMKIFVNTF